MESSVATAGIGYKIWGVDGAVYGPVELPALVTWVKEERVTAATWIYGEQSDAWRKAAEVPELRMFFQSKTARHGEPPTEIIPDRSIAGLKPGLLRRVKILAEMTDDQ